MHVGKGWESLAASRSALMLERRQLVAPFQALIWCVTGHSQMSFWASRPPAIRNVSFSYSICLN